MRGVEGHRLRLLRLDPERDLVRLGEGGAAHWVTSPVRTWVDLGGAGLPLEDLVVAGDSLLRRPDGPRGGIPRGWAHPLATTSQMEDAVAALRGRRGGGALRTALTQVRSGSDSPQETRLRLRLVRAGLPEPEVNPDVVLLRDYEGRVLDSVSVDLFYAEARVAIQYEGSHHFTRADQYRRDMRRDERLREAGIEVLRVDRAVFGVAEWARFLRRVEHLLEGRGRP